MKASCLKSLIMNIAMISSIDGKTENIVTCENEIKVRERIGSTID